jgi:hypothetical protein
MIVADCEGEFDAVMQSWIKKEWGGLIGCIN